jgi:photosystem II stability/assembly factor-like uncharacterized protein
MRRLIPVLFFIVTAVTTTPACAQTRAARQPEMMPRTGAMSMVAPLVDPALFQGLEYRLVGPSRGGRSTTVTGVPSQPNTFYMGVASGGLFKTTDGGESWLPVTDGQVPLGSTGSVAVADSDPEVVYLGTGSDGVRSNVSTGRGVYRSADGGATWSFAGLYEAGQIGAVRIHPTDPNTVWVAANGNIFRNNPERGVFKTTDGGRTWRHVLAHSDSIGAMDVELKPGDPNTVYAWMSRLERKPWTIISGSRVGGFFKSTDGGETWRQVRTGLPAELIGKGNVAVTAANPERIYALIEAVPGGGLYRSDDSGEHWQQVNDQGSMIQRPFYYTTLGADPTDADVVYAGAEGFYKSTDGGVTVRTLRTPHGDNHDIWVNPDDGRILVQCNDGGANVSFDGGQTWSTQMNQPTAEIYGVWVDDAFPYQLYGAQQDNTTLIISSLADPYDLEAWRTGPGCETGPIMPHPADPNIVLGSCKGRFEWMNLATGQSKPYWVGVESLYGMPTNELIYRIQRVAPMETSPHDPDVIYYGTQYVHRTRDLGVNWERISPDLTWNPPQHQGISGEPITRDMTGEEIYSTLYTIRESVLEPGVIWVGANDGPFHITRDDGRTWTDITPPDLAPGGRVQFIDPSPHRPGSAYYAVYRYLLGDFHPYLYRTDDYGRTWTLLTDGTNGIPADWPTRVVREDPDREGLLYAGTEFGLFISFDNGAHWQPFQLNLPNVPVTDIKVHHQDLVVSTQGRAFWILDNITSLHQIGADTATDQIVLYPPRPGYRTRIGANILGPNFEYYLPAGTTGPVTLEVLEPSGALVNRYVSVGTAGVGQAQPQGARGGQAPMMGGRFARGGRNAPVTATTGHNRYVWDVRDEAGLTVPPGSYQVRMTVAGQTLTRPFEVRIDPHLAAEGLTPADLVELYEHSQRMRDLVSEVNALTTRVRQARERLAGATGAAADTLARVEELARVLETEPVRYGRPGLQAQVSYLNGAAGRTDQKLGREVIARYEQLREEVAAARVRIERVLGSGG